MVDKLYFYLKNMEEKFLLFHNPKCACTTLKGWAYSVKYPESTEWKDETIRCAIWMDELVELGKDDEFKRILVVRNPIHRFVSSLNSPVIFDFIGEYYGKERISIFLDYLINIRDRELLPDIHLQPQFIDHQEFFTHIIRLEDAPLIPTLNSIVGVDCLNISHNITSLKFENPKYFTREGVDWGYNVNKDFDYTKIEKVTVEDLTEKHIKIIKELYRKDFNYYPEEL